MDKRFCVSRSKHSSGKYQNFDHVILQVQLWDGSSSDSQRESHRCWPVAHGHRLQRRNERLAARGQRHPDIRTFTGNSKTPGRARAYCSPALPLLLSSKGSNTFCFRVSTAKSLSDPLCMWAGLPLRTGWPGRRGPTAASLAAFRA